MKKKKIVFVTTNRADYNIQKEIINNLNKNKKLIIFTNIGNAFIKKFGYTKSDLKLAKLNTVDVRNLAKNDKRESVLDTISSIKNLKY